MMRRESRQDQLLPGGVRGLQRCSDLDKKQHHRESVAKYGHSKFAKSSVAKISCNNVLRKTRHIVLDNKIDINSKRTIISLMRPITFLKFALSLK